MVERDNQLRPYARQVYVGDDGKIYRIDLDLACPQSMEGQRYHAYLQWENDEIKLLSLDESDFLPNEDGQMVTRENQVTVCLPPRYCHPRGRQWRCSSADCRSVNYLPEQWTHNQQDVEQFLPDTRCRHYVMGQQPCEHGLVPLPGEYLIDLPVGSHIKHRDPLEWWECCVCGQRHHLHVDVTTPQQLFGDGVSVGYGKCVHTAAYNTVGYYYEKSPHTICWNCNWKDKPADGTLRKGEFIDFRLQNFLQNLLDEQRKGATGVGGEHFSAMPRFRRHAVWTGPARFTQPRRNTWSIIDEYSKLVGNDFKSGANEKKWKCHKCDKVRRLPNWVTDAGLQKLEILPWTICDGESPNAPGVCCTHVMCSECDIPRTTTDNRAVDEGTLPSVIRCCACSTWREVPSGVNSLQDFWVRAGTCSVQVRYPQCYGWEPCGHAVCFQCWWPGSERRTRTKLYKVDRKLPVLDVVE